MTANSQRQRFSKMLKILREHFQLAMVIILCSCAIIAIAPFAVARALSREWLLAILDSGIVMGMVVILVLALRTGRVRLASIVLSMFYTTAGVTMVHLKSDTLIYWIYPISIANFFILPARYAGTINLCALLALTPLTNHFKESLEFFELLVTLLLVNVFAWVFSWRTEDQRQQLQQQATIDPLTGIGNRRKLSQFLETQVIDQTAVFSGAVILVDLDHFKEINDTYGHDQGDAVLQKVANIIHGRLRANNDEVYRYGGEEFLLLLHNTTLAGAIQVAESLRLEIAQTFKEQTPSLTASFGCAQHHPKETWNHWIKRADQALYQAKDSGRNCVQPPLAERYATE